MTTTADLPALPALAVGSVRHAPAYARSSTRSPTATTRGSSTSTTPPRLPRGLRWLAGFRGADHLSGRSAWAGAAPPTIAGLLEGDGVDTADLGRVVILAHARVLGYVFNPMSAFWCFASDGRLLAVVVEVHNTYGGRHSYVLRPDARGHDEVAKAFYVSPFNDVSGDYDIRIHLRPDRVGVAIRLTRGSEPLITASVAGRCVPATTGAVVRTAVTPPAHDAAGHRPHPGPRHLAVAASPPGPTPTPRPCGGQSDDRHHASATASRCPACAPT